ncbi:uncharacterized protein [Diabrotica undecimpunctata]|uniref:uncharacterized protein n=1 Tax=Diabrotica undecimpunctata TaxID=50387 RepID=UPI003B63212F
MEYFGNRLMICFVRANVLYDQSQPGYSNRDLSDSLWQIIASRLNKTVPICVKKWQMLPAGYRKRRHEYEAPSGSGAKPIKKWVYFDHLTFLERHIQPTKSNVPLPEPFDSLPPSEKSGSCQSFQPDEEGFLETDEDETIRVYVEDTQEQEDVSCTSPKNKKRKISAKEVDKQMSEYIEIMKQKELNSRTKKNSSSELFLLSLVDDVEAMTPDNQRLFNRKTLELIEELL